MGIQILAGMQKLNWIENGRPCGFCDIGLWKISRHPNYFGELLMSLCSFFIALSIPWTTGYDSLDSVAKSEFLTSVYFSFLSPLITFLLLAFVSGIPLAEGVK